MQNSNPQVLCFGEALADCFEDGAVIGGAPLNVARHMAQLGCSSYILTALADDAIGQKIKQDCLSAGVNIDLITHTNRAGSGKVLVHKLSGSGHEFEIEQESAWDYIHIEDTATPVIQTSDCLIYGTLALRKPNNRATLNKLTQQFEGLVVCDFNWREGHLALGQAVELIQYANWLKLNETELELLLKHLSLSSPQELLTRLELDLCIVTLGPDGYQVYDRNGERLKGKACPVSSLVDTVGAGDSFLACTLAAHLQGHELEPSLSLAAKLAAQVCSIKGAVPTDPNFYLPFRASIQTEQTQ